MLAQSPPNSEIRVRILACGNPFPVVIQQFTVQNPDQLYVLVFSDIPTTFQNITDSTLGVILNTK